VSETLKLADWSVFRNPVFRDLRLKIASVTFGTSAGPGKTNFEMRRPVLTLTVLNYIRSYHSVMKVVVAGKS
jgi:hypothetical protein